MCSYLDGGCENRSTTEKKIVMFKLEMVSHVLNVQILPQLRLPVLQSGNSIEKKREVIIKCLIDHLGEDPSALITTFEVGAINLF